jgi:hypothetical protein
MMRLGMALALVMCLTLGAVLEAQTPPPAVPVVAMTDQFELPHNATEHRGDIVVLIYGDRRSADANRALGEQVHVSFHPSAKGQAPAQARKAPVRPIPGGTAAAPGPNVLAIPVACVGKVPTLVRRVIRAQIKSGSPEVPVWLDFEDVMKGQFAFTPAVPNVAVLDAQGRLRYAVAGQPTLEGTNRLLQVIETLRREAGGTGG